LRAERSNPETTLRTPDCFVALRAPRNDGTKVLFFTYVSAIPADEFEIAACPAPCGRAK
jgi:hypothetical protein